MQAYFQLTFCTKDNTFRAIMPKKDMTSAKLLKLAREAKLIQEQSKGNNIVKGDWPEWTIYTRPIKDAICTVQADTTALGMGL